MGSRSKGLNLVSDLQGSVLVHERTHIQNCNTRQTMLGTKVQHSYYTGFNGKKAPRFRAEGNFLMEEVEL